MQPSELSSALKKALKDRVDAAVADKRLTKEQGDALKKRIDSDEFPLVAAPGLGFGFRGHFGFRDHGFRHHGLPGLSTAAKYLGLSESQLRSKLESGKSLADVAKAQDKSVSGLVSTLKGDLQKKLDKAVSEGKLTKAAGGPDHGRRRADDHRRRQRQAPRPAAERQGVVPRAPWLRPGHAGRSTAGRPRHGRVTQPTRIEAARGRAASAKELAVASAAVGFIAVLLLARAGHPGHSASSSSTGSNSPSTSQSQSESGDDDSFDFGSSSTAPSTGGGGAQAQTSVS